MSQQKKTLEKAITIGKITIFLDRHWKCRGAQSTGNASAREQYEIESQPISRVLSRTVIHLGPASPMVSSGLPRSNADHVNGSLFGLAPSGVYLATTCYHACGALLPHPFTLTDKPKFVGGLLSAALSVGSRPPGVTWHSVLRSPDFPPARLRRASDCPADSPGQGTELRHRVQVIFRRLAA